MRSKNNKTVSVNIAKDRLRKIVAEELRALSENVDHEQVADVVSTASKMLKALEQYKKDANAAMLNSTQSLVDEFKTGLERMVSQPSSYVDRPVKSVKKVSLRRAPDTED